MEELENDDLKEIINFYKNKSTEIEYQYLVLQLKHKKELKETVAVEVKKAIFDMEEKYVQASIRADALNNTININNDHYNELNSKYLKLKKANKIK